MMSLPFLGVVIAFVLAAARARAAAVIVLLASVVVTLVLFRLHATDVLTIDL